MVQVRNTSGELMDVRHWLGRGVEADEVVDVDAEVVDRLPDAVVLELPDGQQLALPRSRWSVEGDGGDTMREVLARVGADPDAARAALAAETDTGAGGRNRPRLVRALERIAAGDTAAAQQATRTEAGRLTVPAGMDIAPATATADNPLGLLPGTGQGE